MIPIFFYERWACNGKLEAFTKWRKKKEE